MKQHVWRKRPSAIAATALFLATAVCLTAPLAARRAFARYAATATGSGTAQVAKFDPVVTAAVPTQVILFRDGPSYPGDTSYLEDVTTSGISYTYDNQGSEVSVNFTPQGTVGTGQGYDFVNTPTPPYHVPRNGIGAFTTPLAAKAVKWTETDTATGGAITWWRNFPNWDPVNNGTNVKGPDVNAWRTTNDWEYYGDVDWDGRMDNGYAFEVIYKVNPDSTSTYPPKVSFIFYQGSTGTPGASSQLMASLTAEGLLILNYPTNQQLFPKYDVPANAFDANEHTVRYEFQGGSLTVYLDGMFICCAPIFTDDNGDPLTVVGQIYDYVGSPTGKGYLYRLKFCGDQPGDHRWSQGIMAKGFALYRMNDVVPAGNIPPQAGGYYKEVNSADLEILAEQID